MEIDLKRFQATFFEEAAEHLETIESGLLRLEETGDDVELLNTIFRAAHSIKGAAGSFGFNELASLTHALENVLDHLRSGRRASDPALTQLLLSASDTLGELVTATKKGEAAGIPIAELVHGLEASVNSAAAPAVVAAVLATAVTPVAGQVFHITFEPEREFFRQGQDLFLLFDEIAQLGEVVESRCHLESLPDLEALDPEASYLGWEIRVRTKRSERDVRDIFLFVEGACRLEIVAEVEAVVEAGATHATTPAATTAATAPAPERRVNTERRVESSSIRVPTDKVDGLINLIGELVISQAMVNQSLAEQSLSAALEEALSAVQRTTRELQEQVMAIRMLPIGTVFQRFPRLVHDLGVKLGKRVRLDIEGAETELDKGVIEQLGDPLTHLIRNSVDHGIEDPEQRRTSGKPEEGVVTLRAFHEGGNVIIEVADDGKGLDRARIRDKAVAQGLMRPDQVLNDEDVYGLIFAPGFSTAAVVSDVSGRGVGMDVVKRNVESLNGAITVSSTPGDGSRFRIRLPLTLAILDGLLVQLGREVFIVPLLSIRQSVRPAAEDVRNVLGGRGEVFLLRGEQLPLVRLSRLFSIAGTVEDPTKGIVVVTETDGHRFGLMVDDVLGQQQVVVKSIERNFRKIEAVMGATILGDGRVAFILDVAELQRIASRRKTSDVTGGPEVPTEHEAPVPAQEGKS